jgi:hypothetical protein
MHVEVDPERQLALPRSWYDWVVDGVSYCLYQIYDVLVRQHVHELILNGPNPMYRGAKIEDICAQITGHSADFYTQTPENMAGCRHRIDNMLNSWDSTTMFVVHFSLLTFIAVRIILCFSLPWSGGSNYTCKCPHGTTSTERVISIEELKALLQQQTHT